MGVGTGLYMYVVVVQKFTFAISSPDEFLFAICSANLHILNARNDAFYLSCSSFRPTLLSSKCIVRIANGIHPHDLAGYARVYNNWNAPSRRRTLIPVTTPSQSLYAVYTLAPVLLSVCSWLADNAHCHPSLASPSLKLASQPHPPPTTLCHSHLWS